MKQEIWKWQEISVNHVSLVGGKDRLGDNRIASVHKFGTALVCCVWAWPPIAGVRLDHRMEDCGTVGDGKRWVSLEIQRQLKAHGIECEIRRVKQ